MVLASDHAFTAPWCPHTGAQSHQAKPFGLLLPRHSLVILGSGLCPRLKVALMLQPPGMHDLAELALGFEVGGETLDGALVTLIERLDLERGGTHAGTQIVDIALVQIRTDHGATSSVDGPGSGPSGMAIKPLQKNAQVLMAGCGG